VARKPVSDLNLILRQFASAVVALLAAAMGLALAFGEWGPARGCAVTADRGFFPPIK
jgi:Ca2+-transporting ATPase